METQKYCVYNQTRESFLSLGVTIADTSQEPVNALIERLAVKPDTGLWLTPFTGIPATRGFAPVDVVCLDGQYRVVLEVESFPTSDLEPLGTPASSALVLPAHTIYSSQTQPGDLLVICVAEEMEHRLESASPSPAASESVQIRESVEQPSASAVGADTESARHRARTLEMALQELKEKDESEDEEEPSPDSTFIRFLRWLVSDRRKANREPLPGLVAYYWTGGGPQAYHIGDVSHSGLHLLTDERWFPGTMILMTLQRTDTDGEDPDDSITVQSKVIRWSTDGMALSFIVSKTGTRTLEQSLMDGGANKKKLDKFLKTLKQVK
jgi:hypothetical protein